MAGKSIKSKKNEAPKRKGMSKLRGAVKIAMAAKIVGRKGGRKGSRIRGRSKK